MQGEKMKVLFTGGELYINPLFVSSPFIWEMKGFSRHLTCKPFIDVLEKEPNTEVVQMSSWDVYKNFPRTLKELSKFDVVVMNDVEAEVLYLYPEFFAASTWASEEPTTFPNRPEIVRQFVENGGAILMAGGWNSFQGRHGFGGWHNTPVEEAMPVECMPYADLVETPRGAEINVIQTEHAVIKDIPWKSCPPILGYNKTKLKPDATLLLTINETGKEEDPLMAVTEYGNGRSMIYASSLLPHWGANFQKWRYYGELWLRAMKWLTKKL